MCVTFNTLAFYLMIARFMIDDWQGKPYCSMIHSNCIHPEMPGESPHCMWCEYFPVKDKLKFGEPFNYEGSEKRANDRLYEIGLGKVWMHFEGKEDKRFIVRFKKQNMMLIFQ